MEEGDQPSGMPQTHTSEHTPSKISPLSHYKSPASPAGNPILDANAPESLLPPQSSKWPAEDAYSREGSIPSFNPLTDARTDPGGPVPSLPQGALHLAHFESPVAHQRHYDGADPTEQPGFKPSTGLHEDDALLQRGTHGSGNEDTWLGSNLAVAAAAWGGPEREKEPESGVGARDLLDGEGGFQDDAADPLNSLHNASGDANDIPPGALGDEHREAWGRGDALEETPGSLRGSFEESGDDLIYSSNEARDSGDSAAGFAQTSGEFADDEQDVRDYAHVGLDEVATTEDSDPAGGGGLGIRAPEDGVPKIGIPGDRVLGELPLQDAPDTASGGMGPEATEDGKAVRGRLPGFLNDANRALEEEVWALEEELRGVKAKRESLQERQKLMGDHLANVKTEVQYMHSQMVARQKEIETQRSLCRLKTLEKVWLVAVL